MFTTIFLSITCIISKTAFEKREREREREQCRVSCDVHKVIKMGVQHFAGSVYKQLDFSELRKRHNSACNK